MNTNSGLEKCIWRNMAEDKSSTTFKDVILSSHPLYNCKYNCNGYDISCNGYKTITQFKDKNKSF